MSSYEDGDTTVALPVITPEATMVRPPDLSGATVVVGSVLFRDDPAATKSQPPYSAHLKSPSVRLGEYARQFGDYLCSTKPLKTLFAVNFLVLCFAVGLFATSLWLAYEAGVIPDVPGITKSDPRPAPTKEPDHKKEHRTPPAATSPGDWAPVAEPAASTPATSSASPKASASTSASPSASTSATAPPEASASATPPASPETTAPATSPSASTPAPAESSPAASEPTGSASATAVPLPTEVASTSPATADPAVTP